MIKPTGTYSLAAAYDPLNEALPRAYPEEQHLGQPLFFTRKAYIRDSRL